MAFRMLSYWLNILDQHKRLFPDKGNPLIFPMVLFQGHGPWKGETDFHNYLKVPDFMKPYTPQFEYEVMDISHLSDREIQGELLVQISLLIMKNIDTDRADKIISVHMIDLLQELLQEKSGLEHIETILYYLAEAGKNLEKEEVAQLFQELPDKPQLQEVVMTLAEQWREEGEEQGIQKGIQKGEALVVGKLLKLKFQVVANSHMELLDQISQEELELIAERILTCNTIDKVFQGFNQ